MVAATKKKKKKEEKKSNLPAGPAQRVQPVGETMRLVVCVDVEVCAVQAPRRRHQIQVDF